MQISGTLATREVLDRTVFAGAFAAEKLALQDGEVVLGNLVQNTALKPLAAHLAGPKPSSHGQHRPHSYVANMLKIIGTRVLWFRVRRLR